jgi:16S rRNA (guanine966-N2)-methyltransferase
LQVPDLAGLRPTPDRVRETLFNWLSHHIVGARVLDLFAGSGVLGFEALSRGAAMVEMVDEAPQVITMLQNQLQHFKAEHALVYQANVPTGLHPVQNPFDIVFLDPPYQSGILLACCAYLEEKGYLATSAYIYLEADRQIQDNELPNTWQLLKAQQAGQVFFHLAQRE